MSNPWGRLVIGIVLAQGLFYGLRHLATGALLAAQIHEKLGVSDKISANIILPLGLHGIALLFSGLLVGSSQRLGLLLGFMLGLWSGVFSILLQTIPVADVPPLLFYGQPLIQGFVGAFAALVGSLIWKPIAAPMLPGMQKDPKRPARRKGSSFWDGRIAWVRVVLGMVVVVSGSWFAPTFFEHVMELGRGRLATETFLQDRILVWEIKILAILLGGTVAGASTKNGVKQGLLAGVGSCLVLPFMSAFPNDPQTIFHVILSTVGISVLGGWFGSHLLPPIVKYHRPKTSSFA